MVTSNLLYHAQSFRGRASRMGETVSLGTHGSGEELMMMEMEYGYHCNIHDDADFLCECEGDDGRKFTHFV